MPIHAKESQNKVYAVSWLWEGILNSMHLSKLTEL